MSSTRSVAFLVAAGLMFGSAGVLLEGLQRLPAEAQVDFVTLANGFTPNPTVLKGVGGGDRVAETVVNTRQSLTGPCLGYISVNPNEEVTLQTAFSNLEIRVESALDTTLIVEGPGGVWCNDDSGSHNPAIAGEWLAGSYRVWVGAYRAKDKPDYELSILDRLP
ncbi:hypothetical protein PN498_20130 [Oscillatoria sp. CS-180]|uniref:hypothetical protein n=1 Tax=Oscillatoria sp. CS-180 TaxID=3021720 RepID=UPI00232ED356|nr:hypothetical protein [Oscillatoria sp. CS-180]MDB9528311.1 hypothetical protein [Oscillatoria sp. CS-180]